MAHQYEFYQEHDGYIYWWHLVDLLTPSPFGSMSVKYYQQGDCGFNRYKLLSGVFYNESMGKGVGKFIAPAPPDDDWKYSTPGDAYEVLLEFVCNYVD